MCALITFFIFCTNICLAQNSIDGKRDYNWVFGYSNSPPDYGRSIVDFSSSPISLHFKPMGLNMYVTNTSISDSNGKLLFYTNGMFVADSTHNVMPHGDSLNYGYYYNSCYNAGLGYSLIQGAIILPDPFYQWQYYIIHERQVMDMNYYNADRVDGLYYTKIDVSLNNGLGDVSENQKNIPIIQDTLDYGFISAVRHGNGRDWWIIVRELSQNCFYRILLSTNGFTNYGTQCLGNSNKHPTPNGQALFSADGSLYVRCIDSTYPAPTSVELYSFDRCSGELGNFRTFSIPNTSMWQGLSISPNSQFLYYSNQSYVHQYDITVDSIFSSQQIVAIYDTFIDQNGMPVTYNQQLLGPDGKIYIEGGDTKYLSVINNPDSAGVLCNFVPHNIILPTYNSYSMPNFPNFRLGKLEGSVCDTLIVGLPVSKKIPAKIEFYPNPAFSEINFSWLPSNNNYSMTMFVYNSLSEIVTTKIISPFQGMVVLDVKNFASGIYFSILREGNIIVGCCKFSVVH